MERDRLKHLDEEENTLAPSTKKFKESHRSNKANENGMGHKMGSYKYKLVGAIPRAFAQAFGFDCLMQEDLVSENEEEHDQDCSIRVGFSKEEKVRMRAPWQKALIIKTFRRRLGFSFLVETIRLPELPIEFYEPSELLKIGKAASLVLRIDSHTANGEMGQFARLYVQVNLDKPLIRKIFLGKLAQSVLYEGINTLCFSCGRIGHKLESCPYTIREHPKEQNVE
ncbi:hypothetical protein SO802_026249 [Lithocarpus litseifolius]|uniref:CCHC-type domain-containing protein n=1 Tax=Lithocarpus litseifolius TaxID=425828 RepID=A0AAW2C2P5_9ROSI